MSLQENVVKLAKLYNEANFTKEQMATEMLNIGNTYETVIKVSLQMDYCK
jgi:hypothetical protein